jgi:hypothetical protein
MAALENRQKPIGRARVAWWPGGRVATKTRVAQPSITASTPITAPPAERSAAAREPALITVSLSRLTNAPGSGAIARIAST